MVHNGTRCHVGIKAWAWMIGNGDLDPAGNIRSSKEKPQETIDGVLASVMAMGQWITSSAKNEVDAYMDYGIYKLD